MAYDKYICGTRASGVVDYAIMLDCLDVILVTKAKTYSTSDGIIQNLLQQHASVEFLSHIVTNTHDTQFENLSDQKQRVREKVE